MTRSEHEVVVAGAGPTGMMLAAELALAEVDVVVAERRPDHELAGSRAGGLHARTLELFDQRGVAERFVAEGRAHPVAPFGNSMLDMSDLPTRHPYSLAIFQNAIERIMSGWLAELGVPVLYGKELVGFTEDAAGITVELTDGTLRGRYLVGCDGGRSLVRKAAGIGFPGLDATKSNLIAEVRMSEEPQLGLRHDEAGVHALHLMEDGETVRLVVTEHELSTQGDPSLDELKRELVTVYGTDFGVHQPTWLSRFTDATRHADAYRKGRVLLAGDAAHVHYPAGGQGLNLGIQDAVNLGWKLARAVDGTSPDALLDSYHAERRPAVAATLRHTLALGTLQRRDERMQAVVDLVSDLGEMDEPRRLLTARISGLDLRYELGDSHPLCGRRMPDLGLNTAEGPRRVFELLRDGRSLVIDFADPNPLDVTGWADHVRAIAADFEGIWELPVVGIVDAPAAVLVRPDGHVAWIGDGGRTGLDEALATWFGTGR